MCLWLSVALGPVLHCSAAHLPKHLHRVHEHIHSLPVLYQHCSKATAALDVFIFIPLLYQGHSIPCLTLVIATLILTDHRQSLK